MAKLLPVNLVCPRCGNGNYMCWLNDASKEYGLKCTNCNTYWKLSVVTHLPDTDVGEFDKDTNVPVKYDQHEFFHHKKPTNADRIRAYTDEELAEWIWRYRLCHPKKCPYPEGTEDECIRCTLDWLKEESE